MPITAKPKTKPATTDKAETFIAGANAGDIPQQAEGKVVTTLRFAPELLRKIDQAAKNRGVSRTAYVMMAVSRAVEDGL